MKCISECCAESDGQLSNFVLSEMLDCKLSSASQWWQGGGRREAESACWLEATQARLSVRQWLVVAGGGWWCGGSSQTSSSQHLVSLASLSSRDQTLGENQQPGGQPGDGAGAVRREG